MPGPLTVKRHITLGISVLLGVAVASLVCWSAARPAPAPLVCAGFTNGVVGPSARLFVRVNPAHAAVLQQWFATGTNAVALLLTNRQRHPIRLTEAALRPQSARAYASTPILNDPQHSGPWVLPGQCATALVAVVTAEPRWKVRLYYDRSSTWDVQWARLSWCLQGIPERLFSRPRRWPSYTLESEWLQLPFPPGTTQRPARPAGPVGGSAAGRQHPEATESRDP